MVLCVRIASLCGTAEEEQRLLDILLLEKPHAVLIGAYHIIWSRLVILGGCGSLPGVLHLGRKAAHQVLYPTHKNSF